MSIEKKAIKDITSVEQFRIEAIPNAKIKLGQRQLGRYFETNSESDKRSREILDRIFFRQKMIHNIEASTETTVLGQKLKTPIMIAPMASMATLFEDGVGKMCTATRDAGSMTWVAFHPKEYYGKHAKTNPIVFIMKPLADREKLLSNLKTAEEEGCIALGIDIDSAVGQSGGNWGALKPLSVDELRKIKQSLSKPFIVKGVLSLSDAVQAVEAGADAIVISNHYGTVLDFAQAPIEVLPEIADAVGDRIEILVDCQIRKGSDILKVLALGGKGVLIGRPIVWAALLGEAEGMAQLIKVLTNELKHAMIHTGVENVTDVSKNILVLPKEIY